MHVDIDKGTSYSNIVSVDNQSSGTKASVSVYPNPVVSVLHYMVESAANSSISVRIFTSSGIVVAANRVRCSQEMNQETVNVTTLSQGTYFLQITDMNGAVNTKKAFVKL